MINKIKNILESIGFINEMFVDGSIEDADKVVAFKDSIYLFDSDDWDSSDIVKKMIIKLIELKLIHYSSEFGSFDDFIDTLNNSYKYRDVLVADVSSSEKELTVYSGYFSPTRNSALLNKVSKQLGLRVVLSKDKITTDIDRVSPEELKIQLPDEAYHGTSTAFVYNILKFGIKPTDTINWENLKFKDLIFFASQYDVAKTHSEFTSERIGGYPAIIKFRIPDKDKLIIDFDLFSRTLDDIILSRKLGTSDELYKEYVLKANKQIYNEYLNYLPEFTAKYGLPIVSRLMSVARDNGVFGYKGRIPASFIEEITVGKEEFTPEEYRDNFDESGRYFDDEDDDENDE